MATMTAEPTNTARPAGPSTGAAPAIAPVRAKRSPIWLAGALALIIAGAVGGFFVYTSASNTVTVFTASHAVARGQTITKSDLDTIAVAAGQHTQGIPVADAGQVIGEIAAVDLTAGSMITRSALTDQLAVPHGKALVGLTLKPQQMPSQHLAAGDQVVIVPVASTNANGQSVPVSSGDTVAGQVASVEAATGATGSGLTTVDVYVARSAAANLTSNAAAGKVALYLAGDR